MAVFVDPVPVPTPDNDVVQGTALGDLLSGFDGNDSLSGGAGDDVFQEGLHLWHTTTGTFVAGQAYDMGQGQDTIDGGRGRDLLFMGGTTDAIHLDLAIGNLTRGAETDLVRNIEGFELGLGGDLVTGTANGITVFCGAGDDTVTAYGANAVLNGGAGRDVLDLRAETRSLIVALNGTGSSDSTFVTGFETVLGATLRASTLYGGMADERLVGGHRGDSLIGGGGDDTLQGAGGNDTLQADAGHDLVFGGQGADTVTAADGVLTAYLGAGDDQVIGARGRVTATLGDGNDHAFIAAGTVFGGTGDDTLTANYIINQGSIYGGGAVALYAGDGADVLQANGPDRATLEGGSGNDTLIIANTVGGLTALLAGGDGDDRFEVRSGTGRAVLNGGGGEDVFTVTGSYMALDINGGGGVSQLQAQTGYGFVVDFQGGDRGDTVHAFLGTGGAEAKINARLLGGHDVMSAATGAGIRGTIDGGDGNDSLSGFTAGSLSGGAGDDVLSGFFRNNTVNAGQIFGGDGNDHIAFLGVVQIDGGDGDDHIIASQTTLFYGGFVYSDTGDIHGGAGQDTVEIGEGSFAIYTADATPTLTLSRDVIGVETILLTGGTLKLDDFIGLDLTFGSGNDTLVGHVAGHVYHMGGGSDRGSCIGAGTIHGDDGRDWLEPGGPGQAFYGGAGDDILIVHNLASGYGGTGNDIVETGLEPGVGMTLDGGGGDDALNIYRGLGLVVRGGDGDDWARVGFAVTGSVDLGAGSDTADLREGQTFDIALRLGTGADTLVAAAQTAGTALVRDFDPTQDFLQIEGVLRLRAVDSVTETQSGVTLVEGAFTLTLNGVTGAQLVDAVFLDYLV